MYPLPHTTSATSHPCAVHPVQGATGCQSAPRSALPVHFHWFQATYTALWGRDPTPLWGREPLSTNVHPLSLSCRALWPARVHDALPLPGFLNLSYTAHAMLCYTTVSRESSVSINALFVALCRNRQVKVQKLRAGPGWAGPHCAQNCPERFRTSGSSHPVP